MTSLEEIPLTPASSLSPKMLALCKSVTAKRPRVVIDHILQHGMITTDELAKSYGHAPRAARDVREAGIPLITHNVKSPTTGKRMGAYTFDDIAKIKAGRIGGRKAFPKRFKQELIALYGQRDTVTGDRLNERYLQIDHRVPYEIAGDDADSLDPREFMLLDASSNRAKSWSCEHCENFLRRSDPALCRSCLWASPEDYSHIAMSPARRVELIWRDDEITAFEKLKLEAEQQDVDLSHYLKMKLSSK